MVAGMLPMLLLVLLSGLAENSQAEGGRARGDDARSASRRELAGSGQMGPLGGSADGPHAADEPASRTRVIAGRASVHVRTDEQSYAIGTLGPGTSVRVLRDTGTGWTLVAPPATAIAWIERAALDWRRVEETVGRGKGPRGAGLTAGLPSRARVAIANAEVRAGHSRARMPGPPWARLLEGAEVELVDRPPVAMGQGAGATLWFAIVPPKNAAGYVLTGRLQTGPAALPPGRRQASPPPRATAFRAEASLTDVPAGTPLDADLPPIADLPPDARAEIQRIDAARATTIASRAVENWRFDAVREDYLAVLRRAGNQPAVEEALRARLALVTRLERAARSARTFSATLERSRQRDARVDEVRRALARADHSSTRTYDAIGFIQPSSRTIDGRRLQVLVGPRGTTIAYLDVPPGIDLGSLTARRVGVFGTTHYDRDLESPLISVRDMETVTGRRRR